MKRLGFVTVVFLIAALLPATQPLLAADELQLSGTAQTYEQAVRRVKSFVEVDSDGFIIMDPPPGIVRSIDPDVYSQLVTTVEATNSMIAEGYLVCNEDLSIEVTDLYVDTVRTQLEELGAEEYNVYVDNDGFSTNTVVVINGGGGGGSSDPSSPYYRGVTKVEWYWYGFDLYLSNYHTILFCGGISMSAVFAALLPFPFNYLVPAALIGLVGIIAATNAEGRGVIISFLVVYQIYPLPPILIPYNLRSQ